MTDARDSRAIEHLARFEHSAMPQVTCTMQGRLADVNDAFCRLVDRPRDALVGRPVAHLNHADDLGLADAALDELMGERLEQVSVERVFRGAGGDPVPALIDADLLRDADGVAFGAAAFVHDLRRLRSAERRQLQQEEFFLALAQRATDLAIVANGEGRMLYISPAISSMLGYSPDDELLRIGYEFIHPEDVPRVEAEFGAVVRDGGTRTVSLRVRAADGGWRHVEETMTNMLATPVGGIVCNLRDVSEQVHAQQALAASEARYRAIVEHADEGIWVVARDGRTTFVNARMLAITGLTADQVYATSPMDLLDEPAARHVAERLSTRSQRGPERYEIDYRHPDGGLRHLSVSATPLQDDTGFEGSLALVSDITATRSATRLLQHAAAHDTLTGLPNRSELESGVVAALHRSPDSTAVVFIDLDHFKVVNDERGHGAGDELLREVARRLVACARPGDLVARFGGDEFAVVCEGVTPEAAHAVASQLLDAVERPVQVAGGWLHATASVGIALSPASTAERLLGEADVAMYAAKAAGRRAVRFFDDSLASMAEDRYRLSHDLRAALAAGQLHLAYQPVVCLQTGRVLGVEALARWQHPEIGSVSPERFVPVALETGLSAELDFWALRTAAEGLARLRAAGAVAPEAYVAVNLSTRTLDHPSFLMEVARAVTRNGLQPRDLVLEVTETTVVTQSDSSLQALRSLASAGHPIAIDDFGTGHSALAYLRQLPASILKIDRSFVCDLASSHAARVIAGSVVGLAHGLEMQVVAEGVETGLQAEVLRELGCGGAQGWWWSPAVPLETALGGVWLDLPS